MKAPILVLPRKEISTGLQIPQGCRKQGAGARRGSMTTSCGRLTSQSDNIYICIYMYTHVYIYTYVCVYIYAITRTPTRLVSSRDNCIRQSFDSCAHNRHLTHDDGDDCSFCSYSYSPLKTLMLLLLLLLLRLQSPGSRSASGMRSTATPPLEPHTCFLFRW